MMVIELIIPILWSVMGLTAIIWISAYIPKIGNHGHTPSGPAESLKTKYTRKGTCEMETIEEFKLGTEGSIFDLPLLIRQKIHKEVSELLEDVDKEIKKAGGPVGARSEEWPVTYMFGEDRTVVVLIAIVKPDLKEVGKVLTFNFPRDGIDKLLK